MAELKGKILAGKVLVKPSEAEEKTSSGIIIPDTAVIQIEMGKESEEKVILTFDGQVGFDLYRGDKVVIQESKEKIRLLRPPDHSYFNILRTKLMWGGTTFSKNEDH